MSDANLLTNSQTTSLHQHGFWSHIKWNSEGTIGVDQHGNRWFDRESPIREFTETVVPKQNIFNPPPSYNV